MRSRKKIKGGGVLKRIAEFQKVSFDQFVDDYKKINQIDDVRGDDAFCLVQAYKDIKLPVRATSGSAGYDFFSPFDLKVPVGETVTFPTGIRCRMKYGWVLLLFPRSSLGLKYRFQLDNQTGVIDEDYYYANNEGHIMAKFTNDGREGKTVEIEAGKAYMQGVFVRYGITIDDRATGKRNGGIGSTDAK